MLREVSIMMDDCLLSPPPLPPTQPPLKYGGVTPFFLLGHNYCSSSKSLVEGYDILMRMSR